MGVDGKHTEGLVYRDLNEIKESGVYVITESRETCGYIVGVDLAKGDYSSLEHCACSNPNGFKFLGHGDDYQVWLHIQCGGHLIRPLIKTKRIL